jgi:UDP-N-acetyl-D-mannosaminuronic acid dehydrogenase
MSKKVLVCGCGRIGSPLLTFLAEHFDAYGVDVDEEILGTVTARFEEHGWQKAIDKLEKVPAIYDYETLKVMHVPHNGAFDVCVITCGTPVDNNQNPDTSQLKACGRSLMDAGLIDENTLVIMRSTLFPGGTRWFQRFIKDQYDVNLKIIFCPERIAEGYTFDELANLPQIIAGDNFGVLQEAEEFFSKFSKDIQILRPVDGGTVAGELAKLMCNVWRYITFATANEFSMMCDSNGVNFNAVRKAVNTNYKRADIPMAALNLGGPCLGKDAKILSAFSNIDEITESAYKVAEKTCIYYIDKYKKDIPYMKVAVLGLAFKAGSDNNMNSLSYKAIKHLEILGARKIMTHDPHIQHGRYGVTRAMAMTADLVIIMTEHEEYRDLHFSGQRVIRL